MAHKEPDEAPRRGPARKLTTKKFRVDLLERLKAHAARVRPRTNLTALMEDAFEEYLDRHEQECQGSGR